MRPDATSDDFPDAWEDFFRAVRRAKGRAAAQPPADGLSFSQYQLLAPLAAEPAQTIRALAEAAGVAAPTATRMLDGLERDGHVTRAPGESDRRCVAVELTAEGRQALDVTRAALEANRRRISASLTPEDRVEAARLLRRLARVVEEQLG
jgi:DNA-binding MarR family transcriptional regulator